MTQHEVTEHVLVRITTANKSLLKAEQTARDNNLPTAVRMAVEAARAATNAAFFAVSDLAAKEARS